MALGGLHDGLDLLAPVVVRDAEGGRVGDGGVAEQGGFDLGGVDVHPARDDHVDLAVAEEEIPIRIQISEVSDGEEVTDPVPLRLPLVLVVAEAAGVHLHVDGAEFARGQPVAVVVEDGQLADRPGLADRPRPFEPVLGGRESAAALTGRVVLLDTAAPPVDHRAFDVVGAGCGAVKGVPHRAHVVPRAGLLGQCEQPVELGGHHMRVGAAVSVDQGQHALRRPLVHQDEAVAEVQRGTGELQHGRVVERRADQMDIAVERLDTEDAEESAEVGVLGCGTGQRAANTARAPRGARGVVHDPAQGPVGGRGPGLSVEELGVRPEAVDVTDGVAPRPRQLRLVRGVPGRLREPLVRDQHLRPGVGDDPGDLRADQMVVDGDEIETGLGRGEIRGEELDAVGEDHGERVAALQARRAQPVDQPVARGVQPARGPLLAVRGDQDRAVRVCGGLRPETVGRWGVLGHSAVLLGIRRVRRCG